MYVDEVLADAPLLFWRFNDAAGAANAADTSGNSYAGTWQHSPTLAQTSLTTEPDGKSVLFNGSNNYVTYPTATAFDTTASVSYEAWIKTTSTGATIHPIACRFDNGSSGRFHSELAVQNGKLLFRVNIANAWVSLVGSTLVNDGNAHHVVGVYDGANLKTYVDGVLDNSAAQTGAMVSPVTAYFEAGADQLTVTTFAGNIQDVAYYKTALSATRIAAHHTAGTTLYTIAPASITATRGARSLTATPSTLTSVSASVTASRGARTLTATATPIGRAQATLTRSARTLTAEATLIKLATPWTADKSQSFTRADRTFSAVPTAQPAVVPTPDLVLVPGQILTREP